MKRLLLGALLVLLLPVGAHAATPTPLDTLTVTKRTCGTDFSYTVPSGSNKVLIFLYLNGSATSPTASLNGNSLTIAAVPNRENNFAFGFYGYLVAPTSGTFTCNGQNGLDDFYVLTFDNVSQSSPIDVANSNGSGSSNTDTLTLTTTVGNDALVQLSVFPNGVTLTVDGGETVTLSDQAGNQGRVIGSWKAAGSSATNETMVTNSSSAQPNDHWGLALKYEAAAATGQNTNNDSANWFILLSAPHKEHVALRKEDYEA